MNMPQAEIRIYTRSWCPYCTRAKALLTRKGAAFTEIDIEAAPGRRAGLPRRPRQPQAALAARAACR